MRSLSPAAVETPPAEAALKAAAARRAAVVWRRTTIAQRVKTLRALWKALAG